MLGKIKVIFVFLFCSFMLTGCGAAIHYETSFEENGQGERNIFLILEQSDESKIKGGFDTLEATLKEKAPDCLTVKSYEQEKKQVFELSYSFADIADYKEKTSEITGKETNVQWDETESAFQKTVTYKESISLDDLIQWAVDILKAQYKIYALFDQSMLERETNIAYYKGEEMWTGEENPFFIVDSSPTLNEIGVYTIYNEDAEETKEIKLSFSYEDYKTMNLEKGLEYLHEFSKKFKADSNCNGYSALLKGENEITEFLGKASDKLGEKVPYDKIGSEEYSDKHYVWNVNEVHSPFSDYADFLEVYNFNKMLSNINVSVKYIDNYVSVPEKLAYEKEEIYHPYDQQSNKNYQYIGKYPVSDSYYFCLQGSDSVLVQSAHVTYTVNSDYSVARKVMIDFLKNGRTIQKDSISNYFSENSEWISFQDGEKEDELIVTILREFSKESDSQTIKKEKNRQYSFNDTFDINEYVRMAEQNVIYTVTVPKLFQIKKFILDGNTFSRRKIWDRKQGDNWVYEENLTGDEKFSVSVSYRKKNYIITASLVFIVIALIGGFGAILFYKNKKKLYEEESKKDDWEE